jgi:peptidoglycan/LPS O-acetylase OafA/YrhL
LLTLYGFALASAAGVWDWIATRRRYFGICAFGTLAMLGLAFKFKIAAHDTVFDFFFANVFTWLTLLAFIGYGRTHLSFENKLLRWARDASYPIYILHQTIIVAIGYYVVQQPWTAGNKYLVVLLSTFLVCVALYQYVVKQTPLTRVLFGMKPSPSRKRRDGRGTPLVAEGGA